MFSLHKLNFWDRFKRSSNGGMLDVEGCVRSQFFSLNEGFLSNLTVMQRLEPSAKFLVVMTVVGGRVTLMFSLFLGQAEQYCNFPGSSWNKRQLSK